MIDDILEFNKKFVESKGYEKYITNKYPDKKIAILSCMDTRLTELLPAALGSFLYGYPVDGIVTCCFGYQER